VRVNRVQWLADEVVFICSTSAAATAARTARHSVCRR